MTIRFVRPRQLGGLVAPPVAMSAFTGLWAFINKDDENKEDFLVRGDKIEFTGRKTLAVPTKGGHTEEFALTPYAFEQYSKLLGIPYGYLEKCPVTGKGSMKDQIEARMEKRIGEDHLIRVRRQTDNEGVSGMIRAILPGDHTPFDNRHLLAAVEKGTKGNKNFILKHHNASDPKQIENGLSMRMLHTQTFDVSGFQVNDEHQMGFNVLTSEVRAHKLKASALCWRLKCSNGMMGWGDSELMNRSFSGFTIPEITPQVIEAIESSIRQEPAVKDMLERSLAIPITNPQDEIERIARGMKLSDAVLENVHKAFKTERVGETGEVTRYHVAQAFTRAAQTLSLFARLDMEEAVGAMLSGNSRKRRVRGQDDNGSGEG